MYRKKYRKVECVLCGNCCPTNCEKLDKDKTRTCSIYEDDDRPILCLDYPIRLFFSGYFCMGVITELAKLGFSLNLSSEGVRDIYFDENGKKIIIERPMYNRKTVLLVRNSDKKKWTGENALKKIMRILTNKNLKYPAKVISQYSKERMQFREFYKKLLFSKNIT